VTVVCPELGLAAPRAAVPHEGAGGDRHYGRSLPEEGTPVTHLTLAASSTSLIHLFVWFWAREYVPFFAEITASLVYYYTCDRVSPRLHLLVFINNGFLTFMLTPGAWPRTGNPWHACLNPGALPSLVMRTSVALALGGLFGLLAGSRLRDEGLRRRVVRYSATWLRPSPSSPPWRWCCPSSSSSSPTWGRTGSPAASPSPWRSSSSPSASW